MSEELKTESAEVLVKSLSKKKIEALATQQVEQGIEDGFLDVIPETITATRMVAYWSARLSALRVHGIEALQGDKGIELMGAKVSVSSGASRWQFDDPYLKELEEEVDIVKEKAKLDNDRTRMHVTLSGESITVHKGFKQSSADTIKVLL